MISEKVHKLCTSSETVSSLLAKDPTLAPKDAWKQLYGHHSAGANESKSTAKAHRDQLTPDDLKRALECGNWGPTEPSELFLRLYHDALCTLDKNVEACMVSPPLMGSCGTIPLTVISVVPDIMRHMSNMIVRAEKEVILATNYWQNSVASKYITNAMRELSKRAGQRGERIIFKMEYDRGSPKQLLENHYSVSEKEYMGKAVNLPAPEDIPFLDLQVINYHRPVFGTFHCKYMVVDRKLAVLQSNNIQDNDNMEMMIHLEGPIVDSLYDMALISFGKKLEPPLPSHNSPATEGGLGSFGTKTHDEIFSGKGAHSTFVHPEKMKDQKAYSYEPRPANQPGAAITQENGSRQNNGADVFTGPTTTESAIPSTDIQQSQDGNNETQEQLKSHELNQEYTGRNEEDLSKTERLNENAKAAATTGDVEHITHAQPPTLANENGLTTNGVDHQSHSAGPDAKTQEFLNSGEQQMQQLTINQPSPADNLLPEHTTDDPHYDIDIAGEVARVQAAVSPKPNETRVEAVTRHLNHTKNVGFKGNAPEAAQGEEMTPYIPHPVHEPFPIAMVCRAPSGAPNHNSVYNPQNEVWLSALRNAKKNVFIQTPTLNAEPLIPAIIEACERGIDVYCYICLGYNDTGELLPKQGGTNEMVAHKLYNSLSPASKSRLHYFWYTGKDQTVPIVAKYRKRCCHVKVMIVDEHIGIQGNGNQDTQSWYHSQEINVMFDSALVCKGWIDGLRRNQNTHLYGEVGKSDGIWRDSEGHEAEGVIGIDPGRFSWAKGFVGALNRVRGVGGF